MEIPLAIGLLEGHNVSVLAGGILSGPKLLVDGQAAPRGDKKNTFVVQSTDGT